VKDLAEELLVEESVDADRLKQILAAAVMPTSSQLPAVRDSLNEAARH
jgi:hypothetical protein